MAKLQARATQLTIIRMLLRPIVKQCLKRSVFFQDVVALLKVLFVETAEEEMRKTTPKINVSRLSVMTGIYRQDVHRIFRDRENAPPEEPLGVLGRVLTTWSNDPRYLSKAKEPRVLSCDGEGSEFFSLVSEVSTAVNAATVLFEIQRSGSAVRSPKGLKLVREEEAVGANQVKTFELVAKDFDSLIGAAEENVANQDKIGNVHIRTEYDNIYLKHIPKIRQWLVDQSRQFHKAARDFLSQYDKDLSPVTDQNQEAGGKVSLTAFSLISPSIDVIVQPKSARRGK